MNLEEFLKILACPACKGTLRIEGGYLKCDTCRKGYPIRNGIPIMLIEQAVDM